MSVTAFVDHLFVQPSPQPFIREAITRIKSQMNPQIDPLNGAQPRREYGADADDFNSDASRVCVSIIV